MAARGTAAPRDKDQLTMSERKHGGDPSACGFDRAVVTATPWVAERDRRRRHRRPIRNSLKRNRRRRPAGGASGSICCMAARGTAAPRDKDQLTMSERKHGGDPSACGFDRAVVTATPWVAERDRRRRHRRPIRNSLKRNWRRRPAGGASGSICCMAARGTAAPRDKDQLTMSERKHGGDPSACGFDRAVVTATPWVAERDRRRRHRRPIRNSLKRNRRRRPAGGASGSICCMAARGTAAPRDKDQLTMSERKHGGDTTKKMAMVR